MKIGIFDSGIGGLCVLHEAMKKLPSADFIYYADVKHVPYGTKPKEEILNLCENIMDYMVSQKVDAVVVACNTATSVAIKTLREKYSFPIIGMEPAIKKAREEYPKGRTLVMATPVTVKGDKLKYLLEKVDQKGQVDLVPMPKLVSFAEEGVFECLELKEYIESQLADFNLEEYSSLVFGCTHFNYFKLTLRALLPDNIHFVDGVEGTVSQLKRKLKEQGLLKTTVKDIFNEASPHVEYLFSGETANSKQEIFIRELHQRLDIVEKIY